MPICPKCNVEMIWLEGITVGYFQVSPDELCCPQCWMPVEDIDCYKEFLKQDNLEDEPKNNKV